MRIIDLSDKLLQLTSCKLPGKDSWKKMAPELSRLPSADTPYRKAAVLILLYPSNNEIFFSLIKRTFDKGPHSDQISLPGGMAEACDKDLGETALRETAEELGVKKEDIKLTGKLTKLLIPVSHTEVYPYIGYLLYTPDFNPNPEEVKYILQIKLKQITNPAIITSEQRLLMGKNITVPYYKINGEKVWGATAMILSEFIDLLNEVEL